MSLLRTLLFNLTFYPYSFIYATLMLPCLLTVRSTHWGIRLWARIGLFLMRTLLGLDYRVEMLAPFPQQPAIYACKHQSAWETIALWMLVPNTLFVMKKELYMLPIIGWWIRRVGNIAIDRKAGSAALKQMLRQAKERMEAGYNIVLFPEGTRTAIDDSRPYLPGISALYKFLRCPVVPVALNSGYFWPRNSFRKRGGVIEVVVLPAIEPGADSEAFLIQLRSSIESSVRALPASG